MPSDNHLRGYELNGARPALTPTAHDVQAAYEGVAEPPTDDAARVEFLGRRFRISDRIGLMPLLKFAHTARQGVDSDDMEGMVALYDLIRDCVDQTRPQRPVLDDTGQPAVNDRGEPVTEDDGPSEWDRFQDYATEAKAEGEDLMAFVSKVIELLAARPKTQRGSSSPGRATTSPSLKDASPSPGTPAPRRPEGADRLVPVSDLLL